MIPWQRLRAGVCQENEVSLDKRRRAVLAEPNKFCAKAPVGRPVSLWNFI